MGFRMGCNGCPMGYMGFPMGCNGSPMGCNGCPVAYMGCAMGSLSVPYGLYGYCSAAADSVADDRRTTGVTAVSNAVCGRHTTNKW